VTELGKFPFSVQYRGTRCDAVLVRFKGKVYGYINQCVHMCLPLDCEQSCIFDKSGHYLQCSMHGVCYDPVTGKSLHNVCGGKKLTALKVKEKEGWVYLVDKDAELEADSDNICRPQTEA